MGNSRRMVLIMAGLSVVVGILLNSACAPVVRTERLVETNYPGTPRDSSVTFYRGDLPRCPYLAIAIVSIRQRSRLYSADTVARKLRDKARDLGGTP